MIIMNEDMCILWEHYTHALTLAHIQISDKEDELIWDHDQEGLYAPKVGYI